MHRGPDTITHKTGTGRTLTDADIDVVAEEVETTDDNVVGVRSLGAGSAGSGQRLVAKFLISSARRMGWSRGMSTEQSSISMSLPCGRRSASLTP